MEEQTNGWFTQMFFFSRPPILNRLSDFANVFKAFVGVNYLTLPFAFKESGMIVSVL